MQAPTVVIDVRAGKATSWSANAASAGILPGTPAQAGTAAQPPAPGSFISALADSGTGAAWSMPVPALRLDATSDDAIKAIAGVLPRAARVASPLRTALAARAARGPLDVARLLAPKYPAQPIMSYIPALSWSGALRLARITGDARFRDKPIAEMTPFVSGAKPAIAEPYLLTSLAGHLALSDWGELEGNAEAAAVARKGADFMLPQGRDQGSGSRDQGQGAGIRPRSCASRGRGPTTCSWRSACWRALPRARRVTIATRRPPGGCSRPTPSSCSGRTASSFTPRKDRMPGAAATGSRPSA